MSQYNRFVAADDDGDLAPAVLAKIKAAIEADLPEPGGGGGGSPLGHQHVIADVTDSTTTGRAVVTAATQAAARSAIGAGTSDLALGTTASTAAAGNHTHALAVTDLGVGTLADGQMLVRSGGALVGADPAAGGPSSSELFGSGMPNGVVTATPGTYYTDTAGTCGAWRWLKTSGTGNTGWTVIHGDTGWRNITGSSTAISAANGWLIRRVGNTVRLSLEGNTLAGGTVPDFPAGFSSAPRAPYFRLAYGNHASAIGQIGVHPTGSFIGAIWSGHFVQTEVSWTTQAAWPTTLPGTPA